MTDTTVTTEAPKPTETPALNTPEARTPTGEIKDQSNTNTTQAQDSTQKADTGKVDDKSKTEAKGAPETYADFKLPEGRTVSKESLASVTSIFKELGLSQDQAQKLMDTHLAELAKIEGAPKATYDKLRSDWRSDIVKDSTVGNGTDGLSKQTVENIGKVKAALGPELRGQFEEAMNLTGAGDHPAVVRALNFLAQFVVEGKHVSGNGPSPEGQKPPGAPTRPDAASALWPNNPRG